MNTDVVETMLSNIESKILTKTRRLSYLLRNVPEGSDSIKGISEDDVVECMNLKKSLKELGEQHNKLMITWDAQAG